MLYDGCIKSAHLLFYYSTKSPLSLSVVELVLRPHHGSNASSLFAALRFSHDSALTKLDCSRSGYTDNYPLKVFRKQLVVRSKVALAAEKPPITRSFQDSPAINVLSSKTEASAQSISRVKSNSVRRKLFSIRRTPLDPSNLLAILPVASHPAAASRKKEVSKDHAYDTR